MTRPVNEVELVRDLVGCGMTTSEIVERTSIPWSTVRAWRTGRTRNGKPGKGRQPCPVCSGETDAPPGAPYAYLLGLYLGDGHIDRCPRDVHRLVISCCDSYPALMDKCEVAMRSVMPGSKVGRRQRKGCTYVSSYSKHWPCLFPQHGPGKKHARTIRLFPWQEDIIAVHGDQLIRGLLHSDGSRVRNTAKGKLYPRWQFFNVSADIRAMFTQTCDQLGVEWRRSNDMTMSISRRASVAKIDGFVEPKA